MISRKELHDAVEAGRKFVQKVTAVRYLAETDEIELTTLEGVLRVKRSRISEFENVSPEQMKKIFLGPGGVGIHIESADVDIEANGLVVDLNKFFEGAKRVR